MAVSRDDQKAVLRGETGKIELAMSARMLLVSLSALPKAVKSAAMKVASMDAMKGQLMVEKLDGNWVAVKDVH